jgi:hypothetical protein
VLTAVGLSATRLLPADEVYVFPPWEEYSQQLADRAQGTTHEREYARRYGAAAQAAPQQ